MPGENQRSIWAITIAPPAVKVRMQALLALRYEMCFDTLYVKPPPPPLKQEPPLPPPTEDTKVSALLLSPV